MLADIHIHSGLIDHTSGSINEIILLYKNSNFITILEHFSPEKILYPGNDDPSNTLFWKKVPSEYPRRSSTLSVLKNKINACEESIPVFTSLEFDYADKFFNLATSIRKEVDYLTLSSHYVPLPNQDVLWPVNFREYFEGYVGLYGLQTLAREYYKNIIKAIDTDLFRVVAHLDLIKSFAGDDYDEPSELIDEILTKIIEKNIFLEINIKRIEQGILFPSIEIIELYLKKKGALLIIGSDSHGLEDIKGNDYKWSLFVKYLNNKSPDFARSVLSVIEKNATVQNFTQNISLHKE